MSGSSVRVVLADDSADLRDVVRFHLERAGLHVVGEAPDGSSAVELAARIAPDVVVLDVTMPGPPTKDVIAAIRAMSPAPRVVVYSGLPSEAGIDDPGVTVVLKSADASSLVESVLGAAPASGRR